ncbi:hypothetical protein F5B22DRAFT_650331 [Xylaria bambusicola]|uniref:uncharacterized protein n=1 Tax=Xylaria bambusicola TaxID=326684 RepID=UPI0020086166|nr:uncharacterized protein F5B22DRAFT_650331 [Xylaria bambusicola]KAI0506848.1 hypothetical protein F5B22DRAFT_650331 [Xylaria bambusicola]
MSPHISTETIVNVGFGIIACLIGIGSIIATVRAGRHRFSRHDLRRKQLLRRGRTFRLVRFAAFEYHDSDADSGALLPMNTRDIPPRPWHRFDMDISSKREQ